MFWLYVVALGLCSHQLAQAQLAQPCRGPLSDGAVACVNHYAAVMPEPFSRATTVDGMANPNDTFAATSVPADPSFDLVRKANFVVFNQDAGLEILGASPSLEFVFNTRNDSIHEAPVYVPSPLNAIIFSLTHAGIYEQQIIDLNGTLPTIANYTTTPPVYGMSTTHFKSYRQLRLKL